MNSSGEGDTNQNQSNSGSARSYQLNTNSSEQINQVAGNQTNHNYTYLENSDEELRKRLKECQQNFKRQESRIRKEEKAKQRFDRRLKRAESVVNELKELVYDRLSELTPDEDIEVIKQLFKELSDFISQGAEIVEISRDMAACREVHQWLYDNLSVLPSQVGEAILRDNATFQLRDNDGKVEITPEIRASFQRDIRLYLEWILPYFLDGTEPKNFSGKVELILAISIYKDGFSHMTKYLVDPVHSHLSVNAANMLATYINRFLKSRDMIRDIR